MEKDNSAAKFAFMYGIALVSLIITAVSTGGVVFQIINKYIEETGSLYSGTYTLSVLRMAVAALFIATPIYFIATARINKNFNAGDLREDMLVRKWLSYFILFVSSVVMIGYFIGIFYSFLEGELTAKFILKAATALVIAATVFSYYFYDITKKETGKKKDAVSRIYFWVSLAVILAVFVSGIVFVESPSMTRKKRQDNEVANRLMQIDSGISEFYRENGVLPKSLKELPEKVAYFDEEAIKNPITGAEVEYKVVSAKKYELCTDFQLSNKNEKDNDYYVSVEWKHEDGKDCFLRTAFDENSLKGQMSPEVLKTQ
ncbi:MAG: DUF5671 domain-containing protein [Candidatus Paceibacterota bacterium]